MTPVKAAHNDTRSAIVVDKTLLLRDGSYFWPADDFSAWLEEWRLDGVNRPDLAEQIRQARREVYG